MLAATPSPGRKHLIVKLNFIFTPLPLAQAGIVFGKENNVEFELWPKCQCVEHRNAVRSNDLSDNCQSGDQAKHFRRKFRKLDAGCRPEQRRAVTVTDSSRVKRGVPFCEPEPGA